MEYLQIAVVLTILSIGGWTLYRGLTHLIGEAPAIILLEILNVMLGHNLPISDITKSGYKKRSKNVFNGIILLCISVFCFITFYKIMENILK